MHLSEDQLAVLLDRTQGWAAGLRLALMCLDPADIDGGLARFTGSDRLVAEYLVEEVTDQLPELGPPVPAHHQRRRPAQRRDWPTR